MPLPSGRLNRSTLSSTWFSEGLETNTASILVTGATSSGVGALSVPGVAEFQGIKIGKTLQSEFPFRFINDEMAYDPGLSILVGRALSTGNIAVHGVVPQVGVHLPQ